MAWADHRPEAIQWYWDSASEPWRAPVLDALQRFAPFESVLDLGCHCGPVRKVMRARFGTNWAYVGVDINAGALDAARQYAWDDPKATFLPGDIASALDAFGDEAFDVAVSCSTLMCISPSAIEPVLAHVRRLVRRAVVLQEDQGTGEWIDGRGWAHTYPDWAIVV